MRDTVPDLVVGEITDPHVPEPIEHERTEVFTRPSEAMSALGGDARLTWADDAQVTGEEDARAGRSERADPLVALGSQPYSIARLRYVKRSVPPPDPPRRDSTITPLDIDASLDAVLRRYR